MSNIRDLKNNLSVAQSLAPAARTASANGTGVDLLGKRKDAVAVLFDIGLFTDGSFTLSVEESDDDSSYSAVAAADLEGSLSVVDGTDDDNTTQIVGYKGTKRYIRAKVAEGSSPSPSTGLVIGAAVLTVPLVRPA